MMLLNRPLDSGIRVAGILVLLGLAIEMFTLFWSHPTAIIWYMVLGGTCFFLGIAYYIFLLVWGKDGD